MCYKLGFSYKSLIGFLGGFGGRKKVIVIVMQFDGGLKQAHVVYF